MAEQVLHEAVPEQAGKGAQINPSVLLYCERFVEFLVDLLSQAPTRRFVRTLLEDRAILVKCRLAPLIDHPQGELGSMIDYKRLLHVCADQTALKGSVEEIQLAQAA